MPYIVSYENSFGDTRSFAFRVAEQSTALDLAASVLRDLAEDISYSFDADDEVRACNALANDLDTLRATLADAPGQPTVVDHAIRLDGLGGPAPRIRLYPTAR